MQHHNLHKFLLVQHHPVTFPEAELEPIDPFNLTSFALALLLAFRLDASYTRYMRGRELWGNVVCDARDLVRQASECVCQRKRATCSQA